MHATAGGAGKYSQGGKAAAVRCALDRCRESEATQTNPAAEELRKRGVDVRGCRGQGKGQRGAIRA